eukprot:Skav208973  [mRNA]  locus=scaffold1039:12631:14514:+ [translate_table: standard]
MLRMPREMLVSIVPPSLSGAQKGRWNWNLQVLDAASLVPCNTRLHDMAHGLHFFRSGLHAELVSEAPATFYDTGDFDDMVWPKVKEAWHTALEGNTDKLLRLAQVQEYRKKVYKIVSDAAASVESS